VVTSVSCLAAAGIIGYARYRFEQIPRYGDITLASAATGDPQNFLIVGSDSREQLDAVRRFFDGLAEAGARLEYEDEVALAA